MKTQNKKDYLVLKCRYFKGELENTYSSLLLDSEHGNKLPDNQVEALKDASLFWTWEQEWVNHQLFVGAKDSSSSVHTYKVCVGEVFESSDTTPLSLKAFIFGKYCKMYVGESNPSIVVKSFKAFYKTQYKKETTNQEKRAAERKPGLIKLCKYYYGEETNPWEFCYADRLVKRRKYWQIEKEWVETLATSFDCVWTKHKRITDWHLTRYFKSHKMPLSLMEYLVDCGIRLTQETNPQFVASDALKAFEQYCHFAPIGHGPEKYFAYFNLEKEDPYKDVPEEKSFAGLFWMQEGIIYRNGRGLSRFLRSFCPDPKHKSYEDGVNGWMYDKKYPVEQRAIWLFIGTNYLTWCPMSGDDIEPMGDEYLNFHYVNPRKQKRKKVIVPPMPKENEGFREFCRYYKGEEKNPYEPETIKWIFWNLEFQYLDVDSEVWIEKAHCYHQEYPDKWNYMTSDAPIENKAFVLFADDKLRENKSQKIDVFTEYSNFIPGALSICRFYKGEKTCPYRPSDIRRTYWDLEGTWVKMVVPNEIKEENMASAFLISMGGMDDIDIPVSLKATFFEFYCHWNGMKDGFTDYLLRYMTEREKEAHRKSEK